MKQKVLFHTQQLLYNLIPIDSQDNLGNNQPGGNRMSNVRLTGVRIQIGGENFAFIATSITSIWYSISISIEAAEAAFRFLTNLKFIGQVNALDDFTSLLSESAGRDYKYKIGWRLEGKKTTSIVELTTDRGFLVTLEKSATSKIEIVVDFRQEGSRKQAKILLEKLKALGITEIEATSVGGEMLLKTIDEALQAIEERPSRDDGGGLI